jgi:hypothetical protein
LDLGGKMTRGEIKEMLQKDIHEALKSAFYKHGLDIKIKNLNEVLEIASTLLEEFRNEERIHEIIYYIDVSFNIPIFSQKLFVMSYYYDVYEEEFSFDIEDNKDNITESNMTFDVHFLDYRIEKYHEKSGKNEYKERIKLAEEIFARNNIKAERFSSNISSFEELKFVYPIEAEVFWFLV